MPNSKFLIIICFALLGLSFSSKTFAHNGRLASDGCHKEKTTGERHCHDDSQELKGLYVVDERRLKDLDKDSLFKLHKDGYLQHLYMIGASMGNVNKLISLKNNR